MNTYPLIVVPECDFLSAAFRDELATYAKNGGRLLLVGTGTAKLFAREIDLTLSGDLKPTAPLRLTYDGIAVEFAARWQGITPGPGVRTLGELRPVLPSDSPAQPAACLAKYGRGQIAVITFPAGQAYPKDRSPVLRDFVAAVAHALFPQPLVEVKGSHDVDIVIGRNHGQLLVHLINTSGPHQTQSIQETIAPLDPLSLTLRVAKKPAWITLEPGARAVAFTFVDGEVRLTVAPVAIYDILAVHDR